MVTIHDVAQHAGVSKATVSHVLNNTRPVLPATRQAVLDVIKQLNYRPSAIARSLTTNVTHTVGVLVADITNPFSGELVRGIERRLSDYGYNLIVCNTAEEPEQETRHLNLLLDKRVDGLIVAPAGTPQPLFQEFVRFGVPMVFVDRQPAEHYGPMISIDNAAAGYAATQYLIQLGHRHIAILARNQVLSTVVGRLHGYRQALLDQGMSVDEQLIAVTDSTPEAAFKTAQGLLLLPQPPSAVIAANHIMTLGLLRAIQEQKLSCPADISLLCFDEHPWASLFTPPLTVVKQPISEMCDAAVSTLLKAIARRGAGRSDSAEEIDIDISDTVLQAQLVIRASCRPIRTSPTTL
jgi:LacI family transcriptional regulator